MKIGYLNTMNNQGGGTSTSPLNCWEGYERVPGTKEFSKGSCRKKSPLKAKAKPPAPSKKKSLGYYNKANKTGTGAEAGGGMSQKGVNKYKRDRSWQQLKNSSNNTSFSIKKR